MKIKGQITIAPSDIEKVINHLRQLAQEVNDLTDDSFSYSSSSGEGVEALANTVKAVNGFAHDFSAKITTFANAVEKARAAYIDADFRRATEIAKLSEGFSASPYPPANNGGSSW